MKDGNFLQKFSLPSHMRLFELSKIWHLWMWPAIELEKFKLLSCCHFIYKPNQTKPSLCPNQLRSATWIILRHWALSRIITICIFFSGAMEFKQYFLQKEHFQILLVNFDATSIAVIMFLILVLCTRLYSLSTCQSPHYMLRHILLTI